MVAYKTNDEKKMYNLDGEKIECALGNKEFFWPGKKADKVVFLFLTSRLAVFICP